jgi:hypothetical protein
MFLLRPDGDTDVIPDEARKWSDPDNHMGVDAENEVRSSSCMYCSALFRTYNADLCFAPAASLGASSTTAYHSTLGVDTTNTLCL